MVAFSTLNGHLLQKTMTTTPMHSPHFFNPSHLSTNNNNNNPIPLSLTTHYPPSRNSIITSARTTNKGFFRSKQSTKTLIQLLRFTASNFHHVFPAPLNSLIQEISGVYGGGGGGGGGYGGNWKGFGWGGFDGGGRKKRVNKKFKFWVLGLGFLMVCWLGLGGRIELKNDVVVLGVMCLSMFLMLVRNGCVPEWVLGFCGGGVVVGVLGDKRGELHKFVRGFKTMGVSRRQRRRRRGV